MINLPADRPPVVSLAAALLVASAIFLLAWWVARPQDIVSNGGQFFFIMLWLFLAYSCLAGLGWVRGAIVAILVVFIWGIMNASSTDAALAAVNWGDRGAKILQLMAFSALCFPAANQWFAGTAAAADAQKAAASDAAKKSQKVD